MGHHFLDQYSLAGGATSCSGPRMETVLRLQLHAWCDCCSQPGNPGAESLLCFHQKLAPKLKNSRGVVSGCPW